PHLVGQHVLAGSAAWKMPAVTAAQAENDLERQNGLHGEANLPSMELETVIPQTVGARAPNEGQRGQLWWRICAISLCTGLMAAVCFVLGSILGAVMGESQWSPEVMDFTNFIGILVLFVGMAGAGCVTLKLTASEDARSQSPAKYRIWARMPFRAIQMGAAPPAFQTYAVQASGQYEWYGPALLKKATEISLARDEAVSCTCCLSEFGALDTVAVLPCGHFFCEPCIAAWAASRSTQSSKCPLCRVTFDLMAAAEGSAESV
ncbi:unnamed protein product, partial [Effrenium voratum]